MKTLLEALQDFQHEVVYVKAKSTGHHGKYAQLKDVVLDTKDALKKNGLIVLQNLTHIDGKTAMHTQLVHVDSDESIDSLYPLAYQGEDSQKQGSAITYARRYSYVTMLGLLVDADDDGSLASSVHTGKLATADFYAEKAKMIKTLREKGLALPQIGDLVQKALNKQRVETSDDIAKVLAAAGVK